MGPPQLPPNQGSVGQALDPSRLTLFASPKERTATVYRLIAAQYCHCSLRRFREDIMAPRLLKKLLPRKRADRHRSQTDSAPSSTPTSASGSRPHAKEFQPSPTIAADPRPDTASPSGPGRLWAQAYEAVKEDKPRLVEAYEELLHRVLGGSGPADPKQMHQLVLEGLEKTKKEAAAKEKFEDGMRVIASVSGLVGTAVKHAPESAAAWGGVCLLLQVSSSFREGRRPLTSAGARKPHRRSKR